MPKYMTDDRGHEVVCMWPHEYEAMTSALEAKEKSHGMSSEERYILTVHKERLSVALQNLMEIIPESSDIVDTDEFQHITKQLANWRDRHFKQILYECRNDNEHRHMSAGYCWVCKGCEAQTPSHGAASAGWHKVIYLGGYIYWCSRCWSKREPITKERTQ